MMQLADRLVTQRAIPLFIPVRNNIPDQALVWANLDLAEAFLTAVLALGPPRTLLQANRGLGEERSDGGFSRGDVDGFGLVRLRTGDQTFSFVGEVRADSGDGTKDEKTNCQCEDGYRN
jgi:hypothetical protein